MRIILVVTQQERGGAQSAALRLAEQFRRQGHEAETWFLYRKTDAFDGVEHVTALWPNRPKLADLPSLVIRFWRALGRARPDVMLSFTHYANVIVQPMALLAKVPIRVASQRNPAGSYPLLARALDLLMGTSGVYTGITTVSKTVEASFGRYPTRYRQIVKTIWNGLPDRGKTPGDGQAQRRAIGIPPERFVMLCVGRLMPQKNQGILLDSVALKPNCHLVLAGEGPLRARLEEQASALGITARVTFLGEISPAEVTGWLREADAYAMPSLFEGMSNALLEAVQAGQVILSSDIAAQREVLMADGHPAAGMLLTPHSPAAWSKAVADLLHDRTQQEQYRSRARHVARLFSIETAAREYLAVVSRDVV